MRLTLLEPDFDDLGHYPGFAAALRRGCAELDIDLRVIVDRRAGPAVVEALGDRAIVERVFHTQAIQQTRARALTWPLHASDYARVATRVLSRLGPDELVATTSGRIEFAGGAAAACQITGKPLVMQLFRWARRVGHGRFAAATAAYQTATERAVVRAQHTLRLVAQTEEIAAQLSVELGRPVLPMPMFIDWAAYPEHRPGDEPLVSYLGDVRFDKGFGLFARALAALPPSLPVAAQLHHSPQMLDDDCRRGLAWIDQRSGPTERYHAPLSNEAYRDVLARSSVVVLPYDPTEYAQRTSNILAEALGMGVIPVASAGSWVGRICAERGVGVVFAPQSAEALAAAIAEAIENRATLRAAILAQRDQWRRANDPRAFLESLIAAGRRPAP